jgi:hypothetical protein
LRDPECLEAPDGRFYFFEEPTLASQAEVIDYFNRREEKRRKARKADGERTSART